jgi:hypothetical protein
MVRENNNGKSMQVLVPENITVFKTTLSIPKYKKMSVTKLIETALSILALKITILCRCEICCHASAELISLPFKHRYI